MTKTLSAAVWTTEASWAPALKVVLGSLLIALCAQVVVPLYPVPVTGQTFAVLLVGAVLGSRLGALAALAYLVEGSLGLPVFAGAAWGPAHLFGPTGGYLAGFVLAAGLTGWLAERGWDRGVLSTVAMMTAGTAVLFLPGLLVLNFFVPSGTLLAVGLYPFLIGGAAKILLAAAVLPAAWKLL